MEKGLISERVMDIARRHNFPAEIVQLLSDAFGAERARRIIESLKVPVRFYTLRVNTATTTRSEVLKILEELNVKASPHPLIEEVVCIPVEGPFSIEPCEKKVVADKFACESVMLGADLYAPGVLRAEKVRKGDRVMITDKYGRQVAEGIATMSANEMLTLKRGIAVKVVKSLYKVPSIRNTILHDGGYVYEQSLPAILTSKILDPKPGEVVVDMCASPGGKTTHIAQLMKGKGAVLAFDRTWSKVERIMENVKRLKLKNVLTFVEDSRFIDKRHPNLKADKVLVDPPCSDLGVRPKIYEEATLNKVQAAANYQRQFFRTAAKILKPRGILVYSTCTLTIEENEENVRFCVEELGLEVEEEAMYLGERGVKLFNGAERTQRFLPDKHDAPGFFIAKLRKP
ncbi:MAG: RsmB/NOP family class I SAM-dependent RNA methyltransferase [Candidatus Freyarchaeota archaeon]|nr:SAM-dependent methyltransferase [Candidatus Freyrarchaeum guaymaensis]